MTSSQASGALRRTLGLSQATAIGLGTMVGAGIFVFPGLAAGHAGPAAMISFALGGIVALLVALPVSELATAMPVSGGPAVYVARTMGPLWGTIVGVAQWIGLLFASAFYLVGFARYALDLLERVGLGADFSPGLVGVVMGVLVTAVNLAGSKKAGDLQNVIVGALLFILTLLLGYGALRTIGTVGNHELPESFLPYGVKSVFTTAALVFTSYLGFAQIATVSGSVRDPGRNVPLAMVGSVIVVTLLYVLTIFVATGCLPSEKLGDLGETAMIEVARSLLGRTGAIAIVAAGLLATLSSANASILSGSRAVYALGTEGLAPNGVTSVTNESRVPYVSLLLAGGPVAALTLLGRVEVLAEVASFLHLALYGMLCVTLILLRRRSPEWYAPTFRSPGYPFIPIAGAVASCAVIAFMQPLSLLIGGIVVAASVVWYFRYSFQRGNE
mgnify:CR=1 FL=1